MILLHFCIFFIVECVFMSGNQRSLANKRQISKAKDTVEVKSEIDIHAPNKIMNFYPETNNSMHDSTCSPTNNTGLLFCPLVHNDSIGSNVNRSIDVNSCMSSNDLICNEFKTYFPIPMSEPRLNTDVPSCSNTKIAIYNNQSTHDAMQNKEKSIVSSSGDPIYLHQNSIIDKYKARIIKRIFGPIAE